MKLIKTLNIDATAEEVWEVFAHRFNDADQWMASVPKSYGHESGEWFEGATSAGRLCELRADGTGMKAKERFVAYDEAAKTCAIRVDLVDAPAVFPVDHNSLVFAVVDDPNGGSTATLEFGAALRPWGYLLWPLLNFGMRKAWTELAEELQHFVETGTPHPRKVAALQAASA